MVHYGPDRQTAANLPPICPKCGSHRTQIIGRLEDGKTLIVRCNACGSHSTLLPNNADADALESWTPDTEVARWAR
jgi:hypothetical protein